MSECLNFPKSLLKPQNITPWLGKRPLYTLGEGTANWLSLYVHVLYMCLIDFAPLRNDCGVAFNATS